MRRTWTCRLWALAALALALPGAGASAQQQSYTVFGRARDAATGSPLVGVQVAIVGTPHGALTDNAGAYSLAATLAPGQYVVEATMIGRETQRREITLGGEARVRVPDFTMREAVLELDAVVVTGTAAPTARRAIGNTVSSVSSDDLVESPAMTIDQALQGKVAGAVITSNTGTPGGGVSMRLRGTSSIIGGAEPLFIVDGVIVDNNGDQQLNFGYRSNPSNRLADLDPNDIERIEILKGAAAAALYGSRANNGVVQIFTKRGKAGAPRITASSRVSTSSLENRLPFAMTPVNPDGTAVERFDPQDLIFRDAISHDQHIALSGGSGETRYYFSTNWQDQQGVMKGSDHQKLNVRLNMDQGLGSWLDLQAGANYVQSHSSLVINGEQGNGGLLTAIVFTPTTVDLSERDPETGKLKNKAFVFPNPLEVLDSWATPQDVSRFIGSFQAKANPAQGLVAEYRLGFDRYEMETAQFIPRGSSAAPLGSASSINRRSMLLNNDLVGNYSFDAGTAFKLSTSVGMNHTYTRSQNLNLGASDLSPFTELVRGAVMSASEGQVETATLGVFGQQQVAWNDRLFLTGAMRFDASSTFGTDERWQMYPKLSGSWVLSDEPFFAESAPGWISEIRLRGALGYAGNQPPLGHAYSRFPRYGTANNNDRLGLVPLALAGNPNLKPERQREWEAGFDASFIEDRLGVKFTYYDQYTKDLLLTRPYAPSTGYGSILDNVGELSNKGIELELSTVNLDRDAFGWTSRVIVSRNRNKVEKLIGNPFTEGYNNRVMEGEPLGVFYMSHFKRDENGNIVTDDVGPVRVNDKDGKPISKVVGNPWPDFTASLANDFRLGKSWTASILFDGSFGQEMWNQTIRIMDIFGAGPLYDQVLKGEVTAAYRSRMQSINEAYLEDASYIKLRDLTVRYDTDAAWVTRLGLRNVQFELQGRNLITFTDYSGLDPEINMFGLSTVARGVDFAVYPNPRTVSFGVRLNY